MYASLRILKQKDKQYVGNTSTVINNRDLVTLSNSTERNKSVKGRNINLN